MNPQELRIGNLVWEDYSGEMVVFGLVTGGINQRAELRKNANLPAGSYPIENLKGITLTPEWLERMGFKKSFGWSKNKFYCFNTGFIEFQWEENCFGVVIEDQYLTLDHIQHVHQLQNLYFALTSQELTIK